MINLNHFHYFYQVAHHGSVTRAAAYLRISQPSLTAQIRSFEKSIGKKLFQRCGRGIILSDEGQSVFEYAKRIFEVVGELSHYLAPESVPLEVKLNFGVSDEIERPFAADVVSLIITKKLTHKPKIHMRGGTHGEIVDQLESRRADIALTNQLVVKNDFLTLVTVKMPTVPVCSFKLAKEKNCLDKNRIGNLKYLFEEKGIELVAPSLSQRFRFEIDSFLQKKKLRPNVVFESNTVASLIRAVSAGAGIGFFPVPYIKQEIARKNLVVLTAEPLWTHSLHLIAHKNSIENYLVKEMQDALIKVCRQLGCEIQT